jgi:hypothetical protein
MNNEFFFPLHLVILNSGYWILDFYESLLIGFFFKYSNRFRAFK